jgi:hypothetical protein
LCTSARWGAEIARAGWDDAKTDETTATVIRSRWEE